MSRRQSTCTGCRESLRQDPCGCWVDIRQTRWCAGVYRMHDPADGTQPERCQGTAAMAVAR